MVLQPALPALAVLLLAGPAAACGQMTIEDDAGDVVVYPALPPPNGVETAPLDLLQVDLWHNGTHVRYEAELAAAPPRERPTETYRYWLGFRLLDNAGKDHYMGLRIAHTTTYEEASLIGPNAWGNPALATLETIWDGPIVTFSFPTALLREQLGLEEVHVGMPRGVSDGPHRVPSTPLTSNPQGSAFSAPYMIDEANPPSGFEPLDPCPDAVEQDPETAEPENAQVPLPWGLAGGALGLALLLRRGAARPPRF